MPTFVARLAAAAVLATSVAVMLPAVAQAAPADLPPGVPKAALTAEPQLQAPDG